MIVPESAPCSSATIWARERAKRYGSAAPYETLSTHVQARPARWASARKRASSRDFPIPASPSMRTVAPRPCSRSSERTVPIRFRSATRPTNRPLSGCHGWKPVSPRSRPIRIGRVWPRSRRSPRSSIARPFRAARIVASSSRISPGSATPWIRAAVVTAGPVSDQSWAPGTSRGAATTSPVAIPIRTWRTSPDGSSRWARPARIASAQWVARRASSSWATGQPNTANTASPMNFSRVPSKPWIASTIATSAASTRRRTSSGSCSATSRT